MDTTTHELAVGKPCICDRVPGAFTIKELAGQRVLIESEDLAVEAWVPAANVQVVVPDQPVTLYMVLQLLDDWLDHVRVEHIEVQQCECTPAQYVMKEIGHTGDVPMQ